MTKLKIALTTPSVLPIPPDSYGGLERVVYDLAVELIKRGHEVTLFAPYGSKVKGAIIIQTNIPRRCFSDEEQVYYKIKDKLTGFDIIHDHSWFGYVYLSKIENEALKICHTHHGEPAWNTPPPVRYPNIIGISKSHAIDLCKALGVPTRYVYNGIDLDHFKYQPKKSDYLLFLSRITKFKGVHIAIDIARRTNQKLYVAGGDILVDDISYVHRIMDRCDGRLIRYFGEVDEDTRLKLLQNAKALIFPTLFKEPFGLVVVEAMACGTPVIALNNGALSEIIENGYNGFLCDTPDEMLEIVKSDKIWDINPENCRKTAEKFSKEQMAYNYECLYLDILDGKEW